MISIAAGKAGGGTQGRESKTKSVKNKYKGRGGGRGDEGSDDETTPASRAGSTEINFLSVEEIEEQLKKDRMLEYCPEELVTELAQHVYRSASPIARTLP